MNNIGKSSRESNTKLSGHWLLAARIAWVIVTMTIVVLFFMAMPEAYATQFTPGVMQDLQRLNFSPILYGVINQGESILQMLIYLAVGLLIFWRRSSDRMALFCAFTLVTFSAATAGNMYDFSNGAIAPVLASNTILRIVFLLLFTFGEASLVIFFYLFPSGRFVPRWTRWAALLVAAFWLAVVFNPNLPAGPATYLIPFFLLSAGAAQVIRYRRFSTPVEREQTKWVVFGFALTIVILLAYILIGPLVPPTYSDSPVLENLVSNSIFTLSLSLIPIFIGLAILRGRLWEIDTIINKTLVYTTLTATLGLCYFFSVLLLQQAFRSLAGSASPIAIVISTLAIAALFAPLRKRLQNFIDRRFYRHKYDAARTLETFSAAARDEVELAQLTRRLVYVVEQTVHPDGVWMWLRNEKREQ
jgi:hypothetical protein